MSLRHKSVSLIVVFAAALAGCSASQPRETAQYDLGQHTTSAPVRNLPPLSVAAVDAPVWLDGTRMYYRLAYANEQQLRFYGQSQWLAAPARLFEQRLKLRMAESGGVVASASDGAAQLPLLRVTLEDFSQTFDHETRSVAQVSVRATIMWRGSALAQKSFTRKVPATTQDAEGGARAMAQVSDAIIRDIADWIAGQALQ